MKNVLSGIVAAFCAAVIGVFAVGCATSGVDKSNNHRTIEELCEHFRANGIPITQVQALRPDLFHAYQAWAFQIDGKEDQEIGVYKFDLNNNRMAEQLAGYRRKGYAMTMGLKYPVLIHGSFMLLAVEKNPYRRQIEEAFYNFD